MTEGTQTKLLAKRMFTFRDPRCPAAVFIRFERNCNLTMR